MAPHRPTQHAALPYDLNGLAFAQGERALHRVTRDHVLAQERGARPAFCVGEKFIIMFPSELIEGGRDVRVNPLTFRPEVQVEPPPVSEASFVGRLRLADFALAYYAVMDVTLTERPPEVIVEVGSVTLRDIAIIGTDDDAFRGYCEEARLTTGIAMSLVKESA
jgi:hypothetical protein